MNKNGFTQCAQQYILNLRKEGRYSTAHIYQSALRSFTEFCRTPNISFRQINRENLKAYERYLISNKLKLNTVSTYIRMLRCIYYKGVDAGKTPYVFRLFHNVYTGIDTKQKRALPLNELHDLLYKDPGTKELRKTQSIANLMFQFCGMPFTDFTHLEKSNLEHNVLKYNRVKTGTPICLEVLPSAKAKMCIFEKEVVHKPGCPDYLFSILSGDFQKKDERSYYEYQSALRKFNCRLKQLARACGVSSPVSSYTIRHSWATIAKYRGVPIEMISESLGHTSIKTTQIYLKGFQIEEKTKVNRLNNYYVMNYKGKSAQI
jgi:site-specific recombinase XerD